MAKEEKEKKTAEEVETKTEVVDEKKLLKEAEEREPHSAANFAEATLAKKATRGKKGDIEENAIVEDERDLLRDAEKREKERKAEADEAKEIAKEAQKEEKAEKVKEKRVAKVQIRKKPRHGKKYREISEQIEKGKEYPITEAIELSLKTSPAKFDATVELHAKVNNKEKNIRGMVVLPGGLVKEKKIQEVSEQNVEEVIADIKAGKFDFDVLLADLKVMPKLAVLAKILGPKGLMPSPKAGTAVADVKKAAEELKGGKVEYRVDKNNVVHLALGKISFGFERIKQNYDAIINVLPSRRLDSIYLTTTMGPSIKVVKK